MSNFDGHLRYGFFAHAVGATCLILAALFITDVHAATGLVATLLVPVTVAGALMPDVDHHASKPNAMFRKILYVGTGGGTLYLLATSMYSPLQSTLTSMTIPMDQTSASTLAVTIILSLSALVAFAVVTLFDTYRPKHRGITHNPLFALFISVLLGGSVFLITEALTVSLPPLTPLVFSVLFFIGFLSHWALDYI